MGMNLLELDELSMYFGHDYVINDKITIKQPKIVDIINWGESEYFSMIHTITSIPSDFKSSLFDMGIDWEQITDFQFFVMLCQDLTPDKTSILFGDLDFSKLKLYNHPQNEDMVILADKETGVVIDELIYGLITNYLCKLHGITKKVEHAKNKMTKQILIEDDRNRRKMNNNKPYKSFLLPLVSAVKVRMGYTKDYIANEGYYEFFDDIKRLNIIRNSDALLAGCYSGNIDTKKINKKELDWINAD